MFAFCHLLLKLFNNVGQKKLTETSVKKQSHDARDILRVSQSVSCKIINLHHPSVKTHFIRLLFKPFSYSLNETSTRSNKQCVWNQSEAMKTSGLGLGFLARDKVKLKRLPSRLRLEFQGEVLSVLYDGHNEQTLWPRQGYAAQKYFYIWSSCLDSYRLTISRQRSYCWSTTIRRHVKIRQ